MLWLGSSDVPAWRQGAKMVRNLSGTAKEAVEDLTAEEILSRDGANMILSKLESFFAPYLEQMMPRAFERAEESKLPSVEVEDATEFSSRGKGAPSSKGRARAPLAARSFPRRFIRATSSITPRVS